MDNREKLAKLIETHRYFEDGCGPIIECSSAHIAGKLIENGAAFAADPNIDVKWISTDVKLPEDDFKQGKPRTLIMCIVCTEKGTVKFCSRIRKPLYDGSQEYTPWGWQKKSHVQITHWMPLPEPPKEDA